MNAKVTPRKKERIPTVLDVLALAIAATEPGSDNLTVVVRDEAEFGLLLLALDDVRRPAHSLQTGLQSLADSPSDPCRIHAKRLVGMFRKVAKITEKVG